MAKSSRLELRVADDLLARVDAARGDVSRTRWVERAIEEALLPRVFAERGELSGGGSGHVDGRGSVAPSGGQRVPVAGPDRAAAFRRARSR